MSKKTANSYLNNKLESPLKVAGYIRVSTQEQAESGHSVIAQRSAIESFSIARGYQLVQIFSDEGVSGTIHPDQRDGLTHCLAAINNGLADCLMVYKNDRIARRASYQKEVIYSLIESGKKFISISENVDTATASGKLFLNLLAEFAEYEIEMIRERTKMAIDHLKKSGQAYNKSLFGYDKIGSKKKGDEISIFVENEEEQRIIMDIISLYDSGLSWIGVGKELYNKYHRKFYPMTLRRIYLREKELRDRSRQ